MVITKEICDLLLKANVKNRKFSPIRVSAIARAMKNGSYVACNGQTIVVNKSWTWLLDGQHRLLAMRESGVYGLNITIVEIEDDDAQKAFATIDIAKGSRTVGQVIALEGSIGNAKNVVSLISQFLFCVKRYTSVSADEIKRFYIDHKREIDMVGVGRKMTIGNIRPRSSIQAGVLNAMLIKCDADSVAESYSRVLNNKCETSGERLLLNLIVSSRGRAYRQTEAFFKTTKALLFPNIKVIKIVENEDVSVLKANV